MSSGRATTLQPLVGDLQRIFGDRLRAVVAYGWQAQESIPSLALVDSLSFEDLSACAARTEHWRRAGAATPLLLTHHEFERSLDAFPIEYGEIIDRHEVIFGSDPFAGLSILPEDLRRACEVQVKSHLLHLREDYVESGGRRGDIDALVRESAPAFAVLLRDLCRLDGVSPNDRGALLTFATDRVGLDANVVDDLLALADGNGVAAVDAVRLFPQYLSAMERLAAFVDSWRLA